MSPLFFWISNFKPYEFLNWNLCSRKSLMKMISKPESLSLSVLVWLCATPWTITHQAPLSMEFSRQEILQWVAMPSSRWSSLLRDLTPVSQLLLWQAGSLSLVPPGKITTCHTGPHRGLTQDKVNKQGQGTGFVVSRVWGDLWLSQEDMTGLFE